MALVKSSVSKKIENYAVCPDFISPNPSFLLFPEIPTLFSQISSNLILFPELHDVHGGVLVYIKERVALLRRRRGKFWNFYNQERGNA